MMWSILENVLCALEKKVYSSAFGWNVLKISMSYISSNISFKSEWTPGVGDGLGGLVCCDSWGHKESGTTEWLNWTDWMIVLIDIKLFQSHFLWKIWRLYFSLSSFIFTDKVSYINLFIIHFLVIYFSL